MIKQNFNSLIIKLIRNSIVSLIMADKFNKKVCKYGEKCFRKNADHIKNYDHEKDVTDENSCPETQSAEVKAKEEIRDDVKKNTENTIKPKTETVEIYDLNEIKDIKSLVLEVNQMQMPDDFYDFLEFCKSIDSQDPKSNLKLNFILLIFYKN